MSSLQFSRTLGDVCDLVATDDAGKHDSIVSVKEIALQYGRLYWPGADDDGMGFAMTPWATAQACQKLGIPTAYFNRCPTDLQDIQFNHWRLEEETLKKIAASEKDPDAARWMLRARHASVRGILSARYEKLDNRHLMAALLPLLPKDGDKDRYKVSRWNSPPNRSISGW